MKQLVQDLRSGKTLVLDVPCPSPTPETALVRTAASLVSAGTERMLVEFAEKSLVGKARSRPDLVRQVISKAQREGMLTTLESAFNRLNQPMPLGYSSAGTVVAIGEDMRDFRPGQRVACAGGGYAVHAEYAVVPHNLLASLPENVDFESGAFATLGAIALHGFRLSGAGIGDCVAVIGLGLVGLLAAGIANAAGCQVLGIDLDPTRVALARKTGIQAVLRLQAEETAQGLTLGRGCDAVIICADTQSDDPVALAGILARDRARVVAVGAVGLHLPRKIYYEKELSFINSRSYGPGRYDPAYEEGGQDYPIGYVRWTEGRNLQAFADLLGTGRLDVQALISHRFPIEQAPEAYTLLTGKLVEPYLGILLTYGQDHADLATADTLPEIAPVVSPSTKTPPTPATIAATQTIRLGVLGAGNFATAVMLPALKGIPNLELVGIASASGLSAQHAAHMFGFHYAADSEGQILGDDSINTIAILTRHHLHANQVLAALRAGKHVFSEKPLALKPEELDEIASQLRLQAQPLLTVGFNRRFAPLAKKLSEFYQDRKEALAIHYRVNAGFLPLTHWLQDPHQGGGRIIGEVCHFIDLLTFLTGDPPVSVSAQALPDAGRYRKDNVLLGFDFPDGSIGSISYLANGDKAFPKERIEAFGAGRVAVLDDFRSLELVKDGKRATQHSRLRQDKGHRTEWQAFVGSILNGGPPPIPYQHLIGVTRATFAAEEAIRTGQKTFLDRL
jgi:predicted dehydrogenase